MARPILIVAPPTVARKLSEAIGDRHRVITCPDPERATALASTGTYLAIVMVTGYARLATDAPIIQVAGAPAPRMVDELAEIGGRARVEQRARAAELSHLAALPYDEYIALARSGATRDYLLALLRRHGGVVSEAARAAGILRETLHRLLRRHDVEPGWFRDVPE